MRHNEPSAVIVTSVEKMNSDCLLTFLQGEKEADIS